MPRTLTLFHHMHKTGGVSLWSHLELSLPRGAFLHLNYGAGAPDIRSEARRAVEQLSQIERDALEIIHGHNVTEDLVSMFPDRKEIRYVTCLRYPPAQIVSTYNFACAKIFAEAGKSVPSFEEWYASHPKSLQTHWLLSCFGSFAGDLGKELPPDECNIVRAKAVAEKFRMFVTEDLNKQSAPWLAEFGLPRMKDHQNVSGKPETWPVRQRLTKELEQRLAAENRIDMALYAHAKKIAAQQYRRALIGYRAWQIRNLLARWVS